MSPLSPSHVSLLVLLIIRPPPVPDPNHPPIPQPSPIHQPPPNSNPSPLPRCCNTPDSTQIATNLGRLPKLPFPKLNGENPRRWRHRCEKYFSMYQVDEPLWLSVAEMYLEGPADRWYQSITPQLLDASWDTFSHLLHDRFDRGQHELLLRQLFNIHQKTTVSAYVTKLSKLVDQLNSYSQTNDPMYFTMRFIDDFKLKIKNVVLVQRPKTFDTAYALALLQEQVAGPKMVRAGDWYSAFKPAHQALCRCLCHRHRHTSRSLFQPCRSYCAGTG